MDDQNQPHGQGVPPLPAGEETPSKKITTSDDDDLAPAEMSPWQLPWKAISITIVLLILIAGAVHVVGLASNRIVRLSTASIRKHGAEPGEFRPMGGVLTEALPGSKNAKIQGDASKKLAEGKDLAPTSQIHVDDSGYRIPEGYVLIPAGPFWMGAEDSYANFDEKPIHKVYLPPYLIEKHLVTNREYKEFVDKLHYLPPANWKSRSYPAGRGDYPVTFVSMENARDYARFRRARLCTEEEWEKAARGEDKRMWPWGNEWDPRRANANYTVGDTSPVNRYPMGASPYGVLDMAGNVFEWTSSVYRPYPGSTANKARFFAYRVDPTGALHPVAGKSYYVLRGGSWKSDQYSARVTARNPTWPVYASDFFGFRLCKDAVK
jgi:iron(II)-dependent oxidoreductase